MGKKGSWFSAIKRVFTHSSKEKRADEPDKKSGSKERKTGKGVLRHGETKSFIPLFREPSSIEKILGEADQLLIRPPTPLQRPRLPPALPIGPVYPKVASPKAASDRPFSPEAAPRPPSPGVASPRAVSQPEAARPRTFCTEAVSPPEAVPPRTSSTEEVSPEAASSKAHPPPKVAQTRKETRDVQRPEPTLKDQQLSATKLQAAYRGYLGRRSFRALKGLVRLQGVVKGQNVKRQTTSAMKQMQLLVRVQTQIQSRRIHLLGNQACKNDKEAETTLNQMSEASKNEDWDDRSLTKEEAEARLRKKVEAVVKRERAMAYAYSHQRSQQLWKSSPKSVEKHLDVRSNGFPWWWNRLERQLPQAGSSQGQAATRNLMATPPRSTTSEYKPSPSTRPHLHASSSSKHGNHESVTPRSSRSAIPFRAEQFQATPNRSPLASSSRYSKPRASAANFGYGTPLKDDDSLVSCPPFSVPNYMTPTVSAKAKSRANSNPRERFPGTPGSGNGSDSKRRLSFPLTPNVGSFQSNKDSTSQKGMEKHQEWRTVGDFSLNSTASMPAGLVGRRPFNRFV